MASSELNERSTCVEAFSFSTNKAFVRTSSAAAYLASLCHREDFSQGRFLFLLLNQSLEIAEILFHSSRQTGRIENRPYFQRYLRFPLGARRECNEPPHEPAQHRTPGNS